MPADAFTVKQFTADSLYESLSNDCFSASQVRKHRQANYLAGYLQELQVLTVVVEHDYTDGDYLDDYAAYYVKCFNQYQRRCKRLHFFTEAFSSPSLRAVINGESSSELDEDTLRATYRGFAVARPLPDAIIGRTVLCTYDETRKDGARRFYPATKKYEANLFGIRLGVPKSLAFQEQDTVLAACATVALWSSFHMAAKLFHTPMPTPAAITRSANQLVRSQRPIPSRGLVVQQMCSAIQRVSLEPEVIQIRSSTPVSSVLYAYLGIGIPVILGVKIEGEKSMHAVTVVGYSLHDDRVHQREEAGEQANLAMLGLRIGAFYVHDDQMGPFARAVVTASEEYDGTTYPISLEGPWKDKATGKLRKMYPCVAILPVYTKIRVTFVDVQKWVSRIDTVLGVCALGHASSEWDIRLTTTNDYKKNVRADGSPAVRSSGVLLEQHPRFLWRTLFETNGSLIYEMLIDATDMARSFPVYKIIWHDNEARGVARNLICEAKLKSVLVSCLTEPFYKMLCDSCAVR